MDEKQTEKQIDRRRFLSAAAGVAAAGVAFGGTGTREAKAVGRTQPGHVDSDAAAGVRKALKYGMIGEGESIADKLKIARDAGFEGVEFDAPSDLKTDEILKAKEEAGIEIPGVVDSVHWSKPLSHPDEAVRLAGRHALEKALLTCRDLGGTQVLLVPAIVNGQVSYGDAYRRSVAQIRRVVPLAQDLGIAIAIENVWNNFLLSPLEAELFIDDCTKGLGEYVVGADGEARRTVGWYLDIGNIWHYGWPRDWLEALGKASVLRLDLKGYSRAKADKEGKWAGFGVEIGDGDVPWDSVREWLKVTGWRGWATAEVGGGDRKRLADIAARMDRVLGIGA